MYRTTIIAILFSVLIISCRNNPGNTDTSFANAFKLNKYDTICIISCISCGGCITDYVKTRENNSNTIFVFDDNCESHFIEEIKYSNHVSVQQKILDSMFHEFGNIILLIKDRNEFKRVEMPGN